MSNTAVSNNIERLTTLGLIKAASERKWGQIYVFSDYADILAADT
jgi:hypothetical protein